MGRRVERTRASGTMTEARFWSFIRSALRSATKRWAPKQIVKNKAKVKYRGSNKRRKWSYKCNMCKKLFAGDEVEVDHIIPIGSLKAPEDLPKFVEAMFCEEDNLQVLCKPCHKIKGEEDKKK